MRALLGWLTLLGSGCMFEPDGAIPWTPPHEYRALWESVQACSGQRGDFGRLRWFLVPGSGFECPSGRCVGRWNPPHDVYISEGWVDQPNVPKHEMLHDLLGTKGHPENPFVEPCRLDRTSLWGAR